MPQIWELLQPTASAMYAEALEASDGGFPAAGTTHRNSHVLGNNSYSCGGSWSSQWLMDGNWPMDRYY